MSPLPAHKTRIVATIGPASESPGMLERLIGAGMNIARLNFSHGDFAGHATRIRRLREASRAAGRPVVILADLPGPKIRLGEIQPDSIEVRREDALTLTTEEGVGDSRRMPVTFAELPRVVRAGDVLFLNDGIVQLRVESVSGPDVHCRVTVGGELRSRKGLNLPGINLGISAFTDRDRECLEFALGAGVDAVSQSFVEHAGDLEAVRAAARGFGREPFLIAKIERAAALENLDEILRSADGVMVARGDLGVEVPVETIAVVQKQVIARANLAGKPVITATQMLESMVASRIPTRAEATDVANAILDGTDAVMLSAESAVGRFPEESVAMLARIARATEPRRGRTMAWETVSTAGGGAGAPAPRHAFTALVRSALENVPCAAAIVPTKTGATARNLARLKSATWIAAVTCDEAVGRALLFSYGVDPVVLSEEPTDWGVFAWEWTSAHGLPGAVALLVAGPSSRNPRANHRLEFLPLHPMNPLGPPFPE